jgi:hypothetical protein
MAVRTMVSLLINGRQSCAAQKIRFLRNWFKMVWVNTRPYAAKVVYLQVPRYGSAIQFVSYAVCSSVGPLAIVASGTKHSVTAAIQVSSPQPTVGVPVDINSLGKTFFERAYWASHRWIIT